MLVFYDLPAGKSPLARTVVTIGNFDGVHLGHRVILARVVQRARELGGQAVAITFDPHPLKLLRPEMALPLLTTAPSASTAQTTWTVKPLPAPISLRRSILPSRPRPKQ